MKVFELYTRVPMESQLCFIYFFCGFNSLQHCSCYYRRDKHYKYKHCYATDAPRPRPRPFPPPLPHHHPIHATELREVRRSGLRPTVRAAASALPTTGDPITGGGCG